MSNDSLYQKTYRKRIILLRHCEHYSLGDCEHNAAKRLCQDVVQPYEKVS